MFFNGFYNVFYVIQEILRLERGVFLAKHVFVEVILVVVLFLALRQGVLAHHPGNALRALAGAIVEGGGEQCVDVEYELQVVVLAYGEEVGEPFVVDVVFWVNSR